MITPAIALLLKAPRKGHVKTRLAAMVGAVEATQIYRRLVEHQIAQLPPAWTVRVHFTPAEFGEEMRGWLGAKHSYLAQPDGDLGNRLIAAMRTHFAAGSAPLIIIGGDCPYLTTAHFERVARLLDETDAVLIPTLDGGYCLFALRRPDAHLFECIHWGTNRVAGETRDRLRKRGISWRELPALEDVDDEASWARARNAMPHLGR